MFQQHHAFNNRCKILSKLAPKPGQMLTSSKLKVPWVHESTNNNYAESNLWGRLIDI